MSTAASTVKPAWFQPAMDDQPMPLDWVVDASFGVALVTRDGECIYQVGAGQEAKKVAYFEDIAAQDPDHDWRIEYLQSMREDYYQRHGSSRWMLIDQNGGSYAYANSLEANNAQ